MTIAWASFTPMSAFLGGCLIGLAALLLMMFQGRIMGVSGIIGGLFGTASSAERGWRLAFLGCTSGHGICGLARFSPRSLIAVMAFMASAVATVAIVNHF